jgi:hypothetical protein
MNILQQAARRLLEALDKVAKPLARTVGASVNSLPPSGNGCCLK